MSERDSWAVGSDTDRRVDLEDARVAMGALWTPDGLKTSRPGFRPSGTLTPGLVKATSPTADGFVHVDPFQLVLPTTRGISTPYVCTLAAIKDISILATPADAANARHDLIVAQQNDAAFGDADSLFTVRHIVGTPSGTPTDPTVAGSPVYRRLARVVVPALATAIQASNITDLRSEAGLGLYTVAIGGILPVPSATVRNAIVSPYEGMTVYRTDQDWLESYTGSGWRVHGVARVPSEVDLASLITHPYDGQLAVVGNDDQLYQYDVSAWIKYPNASTITTGFVNASGWSSTFDARIYGKLCVVTVTASRTGADIAADSAGNITDQLVGTLPSSVWPALNNQHGTFSDGFGEGAGRVQANGEVNFRTWSTGGTIMSTRGPYVLTVTYALP